MNRKKNPVQPSVVERDRLEEEEEEEVLLAVVVIKGELCLPLVVQCGLTVSRRRCSRHQPCSGTPAGWTRRGSARMLPQPPRCGTAGVSGTEKHENKKFKIAYLLTTQKSEITRVLQIKPIFKSPNHKLQSKIIFV